MEDKNILDFNPEGFRQLSIILDDSKMREQFLSVIPEEFYDSRDRSEMREPNIGQWLLFRLGSKQACVSDFIGWFEAANLDNALIVLKHDVPLEITQQPPSRVLLKQGENLSIQCEAISFPRPEYQWFKGNEELLVQQTPQLYIPSVKVQDSGVYYCKVSKHNIHESSWSSESTFLVEVEVTYNEGESYPLEMENKSVSKNASSVITKSEDFETIPEIFEDNYFNKKTHDLKSEKIVITHQPQRYAKVCQGYPWFLNCVASFPGTIKYQWYKNGRILEDAVSPNLLLDYMFPDYQTGETKFEYICEISSDTDKVLTSPAVIELQEPNELTRYFAEDKVAFLIGNDSYDVYKALKTPEADVTDLVELLKEMQFKVFAFKNLSFSDMEKVLSVFFCLIKENSYALFFFAGHGFEHHGQTYLQPIDCGDFCMQEETICVERILQKMQSRKPALNVLLIDACRKYKEIFYGGESTKIYDAHMKNNTVYGYSTSFLSSSYEGDERNSFFVKHLKKYIAQDKSIQDVLMHVQTAFAGESSVRDIQNPVIESSLCVPRKLRDSFPKKKRDRKQYCFQDKEIRKKTFLCPDLKCDFIIENKKMDVFFNGIDISVFADLKGSADLKKLEAVMINLKFSLPGLQVTPPEGVRMTGLEPNQRNFLFKKKVIGIQKKEQLGGILEITIYPFKPKEIDFPINIGETWTYFNLIAEEQNGISPINSKNK